MNTLDTFTKVLRAVDDDAQPIPLQAVRARAARQRRRLVATSVAAVLVATAAVAGPALAFRGRDGAALPARTPSSVAPTIRVDFAGVSVPVPADWSLHAVSISTPGEVAACVAPPSGSYTTDRDCLGGIVITRQVRAVGAFEPQPGPYNVRMANCSLFGLRGVPGRELSSSPPPDAAIRLRRTAAGVTAGFAWDLCRPEGTYAVRWLLDQHVTLEAAYPVAAGVLAAVRGATLEQRHLAPAPTVGVNDYAAQDHGVTVRIPSTWNFFSKAAECVGELVNGDGGAAVTCPVNGLLIRGAPFFAGGVDGKGGGTAGQGGAVTPDPWSVRGYVDNGRKMRLDISAGCARLVEVGLARAGTRARSRVLVDQGHRPVAGRTADYRGWRTTCSDGTTFLWRRWWLSTERVMFDSYDMPGGLTPGFIDALLKHGTELSGPSTG